MLQVFHHDPVDLGYSVLNCETTDLARYYFTPTGKKYPSITTVLSLIGEDSLNNWKNAVGKEEADRIGRRAAERGQTVHSLAEKFIKNEYPDCSGIMPHFVASFNSIRPILQKRLNNIRLQEKPLYSDHLEIAGRTDIIGEWDGLLSAVDIKTSAKVKTKENISAYFMQECGYSIMFEERTGIPVSQLVTVIAVDFNEPLIFIQKRDDWVKPLLETRKKYKELYGI